MGKQERIFASGEAAEAAAEIAGLVARARRAQEQGIPVMVVYDPDEPSEHIGLLVAS